MNFVRKHLLHILFVVFVFSAGFLLRFYHLSSIPNGLYADETAIGYNAYSILITGRDEYGKFLPLYFRSFDDYKLPVYIYATTGAIKAFGPNAFAVRFSSMLAGLLAVVAIYFLVLELSKKKELAAITSLFLAFNPWNTFYSRAGYEVNLATTLMLLGTLFFVMGVRRKNNLFLFVFSVFAFLLSVYSYNVTRLFSPLIFIALIIFYYKRITANSKNILFILMTIFIIGMLPFFITFFSLQSQAGFSSQKDALLIGREIGAKIIEIRSYFVGLPSIISKLLFNYWFLVLWMYIKNLVSFFSTNFFFIVGPDHPNESIGGFGTFYYFEFPLMLLGAYKIVKEKVTYLYPFCLWFMVIFFAGSIIGSVPHGTRTYPIVIPLVVFSAYGMYVLLKKIVSLKSIVFKRSLVFACAGIVAYSYIFYFTSYFTRLPIEYAKDWRSEDQKLVTYINKVEGKYNKVIFDDSAGFLYTSLLFYGGYSPQFYQSNAKYKTNGMLNVLKSVGKYEFRKIDWNHDLSMPKTLFITGSNNVAENKKPLAVFSYPTRPVVIYYDRKIGQFPVTDIAYEVFESDSNSIR